MKQQDKYTELEAMARTGELADELNPIFLFSVTSTELLVQMLSGELDLLELAPRELRNRGLDVRGRWKGWGRNTSSY